MTACLKCTDMCIIHMATGDGVWYESGDSDSEDVGDCMIRVSTLTGVGCLKWRTER